MSYNGSGTYVPPAGQPVATGTVIQSATFNTLVTDIGNTFNNVLPRDGQAPMLGQLKITDGTSAIPGIGFNSEASSGMFRPAAGQLALVASGVENIRINSAGRILVGTTTDDGTNKLQVNGATKVTGAFAATGAITASSTIAATGAITSSSTITATGAITGASYTGSNLVLQSAVPFTYFDENDQTGAAGKWRMVAEGNSFALDKNTAAARDFSTYVRSLNADSGGVVYVNGAVPVQQGTGVGQNVNTIKVGWGATGGGLKVTVDSTDQGYVPFSSTNANAGAGITFTQPTTIYGSNLFTAQGGAQVNGVLTCSNGLGNALTVNGSSTINYGMYVHGQPAIFDGGAAATLTNNGIVQVGTSSGLSIAISDQIIQGRNNGASNPLYLNYYGGPINVGGSSANNSGMTINGSAAITSGLTVGNALVNGGAAVNLANSGMLQIGTSAGMNVVYDYNTIQARNNGAASELRLNSYGGITHIYGGGLQSDGMITASAGILSNTTGNLKMQLNDGATVRGFLSASSTMCFGTINAGNTAYTMTVDNSGNVTASGNVFAYSDESLKKDWEVVCDNFTRKWAKVKHGIYTRIDTGEIQAGLSAQSTRKVLPQAVGKARALGAKKSHLTLDYAKAAAVATVQNSIEIVNLQDELAKAHKMIAKLAAKLGVKV